MVELYKRIETEADVAALDGVAREGLSLDVKRDPYFNSDELSKDVAAFANVLGGVIVVGAFEDPAKLIRFNPNPIAAAVAVRQAQAFEDAVKAYCSPAPIIRPKVLWHIQTDGSLTRVKAFTQNPCS